MDLRMTLEIFAIRQMHHSREGSLPERISAAGIPTIIATMRQATTRKDYAGFFEEDYHLHAAIAGLSGMPLLKSLWQQVWDQLSNFHRDSLEVHWPDLRALMSEHEYLASAIESGDLPAAEDGVRHHLEAIWFRMAEQKGTMDQDEDPLHRAVAYLALHFHRELRLANVARKVSFCSAGHLSKRFREEFGIGFQGYLLGLRLDKAADLLRTTSQPIARIARRVGYRDAPRFSQHFKRRFAMTPKQWRARKSRGD